MIRTTLFRALAALAAGTSLVAASGLGHAQPDPLSPPANGPRKADPTWHALRNATVHVKPGQVLEHATVVVRDGRILSVQGTPAAPPAPKPTTPAAAKDTQDSKDAPKDASKDLPKDDITRAPAGPAGARSWDCTGLHIYPGFIDPYVEIDVPAPAADAPGQHWNARVTPQKSAADVRGVDAALAESLRKLGYTAAAVTPRGGLFRGSAALVSLAQPETDRSLARPPIYAENLYQTVAIDSGGGGGRGGGTPGAPAPDPGAWSGYPGSQMGAIALVRQTFADADWQAAARASGAFTDGPNCLDVIAPAPSSGDAAKTRYVFNTDDELEVFRVMKIAEEFNRPAIVLGCGMEFRRLDGIVERCKDVPFIVPLAFPDAPRITSMGQADSVELRELMTWEQAPTNPRRLEQAGIKTSLTTSKVRGDRGKFRENLRKAIAHGLTEDQALAMITTRPAELLGAAGQMGTVEQGKLANLVVTDGNIFTAKTQFRDVWVDGKRHELAAAPSNLKGEWEITMEPAPKAPEGASVRITWSIDKDNAITIRKHVKEGEGEPKVSKASAKGVRVESAGYGAGALPTKIAFTLDHEPLGSPGVFTIAGVVEGETMMGDGMRADGSRFRWQAKRTAPEPAVDPEPAAGGREAGFAGTWKMAESDGEPVPQQLVDAGEAPTMIIDRDNNVTMKAHGADIKPESVKVDGKTITIAVKGEHFGWEGIATGVGTLDGDTLTGKTTLADGSEHAWVFKRTPAPEGRRGGRRGGGDAAAAADKPSDLVTGSWTGTTTSPQMPQPMAFSMKLKLEGTAVTGSVTSQLGTVDITQGAFTKSDAGGKLTFTVSPPDAGAINFTCSITADSLAGTGSGNQMTFALTATRAAAVAGAAEDEDEAAPKDIPEKYGYPFGPYALSEVPKQESALFHNATIWTSGSRGVIPRGWMLVENGKISQIGAGDAPPMPAGLKIVDLAGKHITPGLIDCHSHTGISRGVNEGGQAVTAEVRIQDVTDPDAMSWYYQLAGGITAVNNLHGSANPIGGQNCVNKNRWGVLKPDDLHFEGAIPGIKFALGENVKRSSSSSSDRYPNTRMGVETLIRDRFTAAREYGDAIKRGEKVRPDLELQCLLEILDGKRLIHCHSYRQDEILMLCRVAKDFGFKLGTFQHILEGYKVADEVRDNAIGASAFSDWWAYKVEVQDAIPYAGAIMHDVGVTVSFNSDSDELARRMNVEAGKAVKYGNIDPAEALKFVTINPARQLKVDDRVGSLEPGKDADFAIWTVPPAPKSTPAPSNVATVPDQTTPNGNRSVNAAPLPADQPRRAAASLTVEGTPMSSMARCEQTWVDGRCYFSAQRDAELRQANATERARLIQKLLATGNRRAGGPAAGGGTPDAGGPGAPGGRRRGPGGRPTDDDLTSGAFEGPAADDAPPSLLQSMLKQAADRKREYYLQMWRLGIDPTYSRCGDCGESLGGAQ